MPGAKKRDCGFSKQDGTIVPSVNHIHLGTKDEGQAGSVWGQMCSAFCYPLNLCHLWLKPAFRAEFEIPKKRPRMGRMNRRLLVKKPPPLTLI